MPQNSDEREAYYKYQNKLIALGFDTKYLPLISEAFEQGWLQSRSHRPKVSLEDCARELHGTILGAGKFEDWWHGEKKEFGREYLGTMVQAILNHLKQAGVQFHEQD